MTSMTNKVSEMEVEDSASSPVRVASPSRKKLKIIVVVVVVILIALTIGLAVGLTRRKCRNSTGGNITARVIGYIDSGTCDESYSTCECSNDAIHYYQEFMYKGKRVVIFSQIPDHPAENNAPNPNPNKRCTKWQYLQLPIKPTFAKTASETPMGTMGVSLTGAAFFNYKASPEGSVAVLQEADSMDSCSGHSAPGGQYHYHMNIRCATSPAAIGSTNRTVCKHLGYHFDGFPVYGYCNHKDGSPFKSCYKLKAGKTLSETTSYYGVIKSAAWISDYEFSQTDFDSNSSSCNLDVASGAVHPTSGEYSYFMTEEFPWMPSFYKGSTDHMKMVTGQGPRDGVTTCNAN